MSLISVIVPAYNALPYVGPFFAALRKQAGDIEIIFVDDGSTDGTFSGAERAAEMLSVPVRVIQIPHSGVSAARNAGMRAARGDFFAFCDVDDEIMPDYGEVLTGLAMRNDFDAAVFRHERRRADEEVEAVPSSRGAELASVRELSDRFLANPTSMGVYDLLIRRDFMEKAALSFPEDMAYYEDYAFFYRLFCASPRVLLSDRVIYRYCAQVGSAMNRVSGERFSALPRIREEAARYDARDADVLAARIYWSLIWQASVWQKTLSSAVKLAKNTGAKAHMARLSSYPDKKVRISARLGCASLTAFAFAARVFGRRHTHLRPGQGT